MSRKEVLFQYYYEHIRHNIVNFLKWLVLAVLTGLIVGGASGIFAKCIGAATAYRDAHIRIFLLLPFAGLLIVFLYWKLGSQDGGTNQVLATIKSKDKIPFISAPLIFLSTLLTHLTGGSAGREGASIQFGGSLGSWLGKLAKLDEFDQHVMIDVRHERCVRCRIRHTDGCCRICYGGCKCRRYVLCCIVSMHDCSHHCITVC